MTVMDFPSSPVNGQTTTDGRYYFDSSVGESGAWRSAPLPVGGLPAGSIIQWGSSTLPTNWLLCDGSAVSRSVYSSLFAVVGTTYGAGDGSTTFNLPDVPNGDSAGIISTVRINSQVTVTTTLTDLAGLASTVTLKGGRIYRISFTCPNLNGSSTARARFDIIANSVLVDRDYVGITAGSGGVAFNIQTLFSPASDGSYILKVAGLVDNGTGTMTVYGDGNSSTFFIIEDMGEAPGSSLRQRNIIKASAGWTAGDSELATRLGALEQNPSITGNLSVAGDSTIGGRSRASLQPSFFARDNNYRSTSGELVFSEVLHNIGNHYNASTGRFTAPVTGTYVFSFSTLVYTMGSGSNVVFRKNGSEYSSAGTYGQFTGSYAGQGATVTAYLSANDYFSAYFTFAGTNLHAGFTLFSGHLVA